MKISREYSILLKSYQLKDFLSSKNISFSTDNCKLILESGFCQSISRDIRRKIKEQTDYNDNKTIQVTLLAITHRILISAFDRFQRKIKLSENFDSIDLISSGNIIQCIIEYTCSLLLLYENFIVSACGENIFLSEKFVEDKLKNELISLTLLSDMETVFFADNLLNEQFSSELNYIKVPGIRTLRDLNKLLSWSQNLIELVNEYIVSVTVPNDLIIFSSLLDRFVKEQDGKILSDIKRQLFPVINSLHSILIQMITYFEEKTEERDCLLFLFRTFEFSANITSMAISEIHNFSVSNKLIHIITAIQLLSVSRIYSTLKLDERKVIFLSPETELIYENLANYYFKGSSLEDSSKLTEEILNDFYLKYDNNNPFILKIIENYETLNKGIQNCLHRNDVFKLIITLLYGNNMLYIKNYL